MKKKGNKRMPTPKQKLIHNPIPKSLFVVCVNILLVKRYQLCPQYLTNNKYISERNKDVVMEL